MSIFKPKTLLVDGTYLLKRGFLGADTQITQQFGHYGGVFNFFLTLRTVVNLLNVNKIVVMWDSEDGGKMRYDLYKGYKANRSGKSWYNKISLTEAQIEREKLSKKSELKQMVRIQQYLQEMFVRQVQCDLIEADDLISYYCQKYHQEENITVYTNDRDLCQLVEYDNVNVYLANKKISVNKKNYYLYFKHHHRNLVLLKTFCGDTSDNIKGVKGLAEKTLLDLVPEIKDKPIELNYILETCQKVKDERVKDKKKPLLVIDNILNGVIINDRKVAEPKGLELYNINYKIIDLYNNPMLTREAKSMVMDIAEGFLDVNNLGSKNLIPMMEQDGFFTLFHGSHNTFFKPFYPLFVREKELFKKQSV